VSAAASTSPQGAIQFVAIGGFGERPILLKNVEGDRQENWTELAAEWYSQAGDAFASADYRSEVAAILVGRVVKEVQI
jgi:CO/xanthine dehydrogenase FAD-binding subunit